MTSIYDADTFRANIVGWPAIVGELVPISVQGSDAPEFRGKCQEEKEKARLANQATVAMLRAGEAIELRNIRRDKYFRLLADVYVDVENLAEHLLPSGLAVKYGGGKKSSWCR